jgi:Bcr/CflA subfamily drug resistance transporter
VPVQIILSLPSQFPILMNFIHSPYPPPVIIRGHKPVNMPPYLFMSNGSPCLINRHVYSQLQLIRPVYRFLLILSALMAVTSLSTDIYLPAMPVMAKDLQGDAELTITGFLIGFCIAQLIWGPISDRYGRRLPVFIGLGLFIIGSVGCALSTDIVQIVFWRVFQALGACTGPMVARAMIRDLFSRTRAAQMLSTLMIIMAIAPIAGPLIGGQMIKVTSWHAIFWLLAIIGTLMLMSLFWLPETLPAEKRSQASVTRAFHNYYALLTNAKYMRFTSVPDVLLRRSLRLYHRFSVCVYHVLRC